MREQLTVDQLIEKLQHIAKTDGDAVVSIAPSGTPVTSVFGPTPLTNAEHKVVLLYAKSFPEG